MTRPRPDPSPAADGVQPRPAEGLARAVAASTSIIAAVPDDAWGAPTPCTGWDARALVAHLVGGDLRVAALLHDRPAAEHEALDDLDPTGLAVAAARAGVDLLEGFGRPGALGRVLEVPAGALPGGAVLHLRTIEHLVHGWDLARATGAGAGVLIELSDLADAELGLARAQLGAARDAGPFGPEQDPGPDATGVDRLAAYLGRGPAG